MKPSSLPSSHFQSQRREVMLSKSLHKIYLNQGRNTAQFSLFRQNFLCIFFQCVNYKNWRFHYIQSWGRVWFLIEEIGRNVWRLTCWNLHSYSQWIINTLSSQTFSNVRRQMQNWKLRTAAKLKSQRLSQQQTVKWRQIKRSFRSFRKKYCRNPAVLCKRRRIINKWNPLGQN